MKDAVAFSPADRAAEVGAPLLACEGLTVEQDGKTLLDNVSLAIRSGEIVTIVGPNGGGKTTLLRALTGALRPRAGAIQRRPDLRIGHMPQQLAVDRSLPMTVDGFLRLGARDAGPEDRRVALARVGIERLGSAQLATLSGGELQRALLARAVLRKPALLMLDEPTQGLDQRGAARFYELVESLRDGLRLGVLLVSHDLHVVMRASDRVICLNGHVCCEGAPSLVSAHPEYRRLFDVAEADPSIALYRHRHDHDHDCGDAACGGGSTDGGAR